VSTRGNGHEEDVELAAAVTTTEDTPSDAGLEPSPAETPAGATSPGDELSELRRECSELREALLRRRADFDNYRKRVERDRGTSAAEAESAILRQLLGTVDNLERALATQDAGPGLREGVVLTERELLGLLESLGVETLDPLGERFDPAAHQAILHEPSPGFEEGTVAEVYRKGFRHRDRLLRPALVKVASGGARGGDDGEVR